MEPALVPADTQRSVQRRQIELWRAMTPAERAGLANRLSVDVATMAIAGIRARHPDATSAEIRYELARRRYGEDVALPLRPPTSTR